MPGWPEALHTSQALHDGGPRGLRHRRKRVNDGCEHALEGREIRFVGVAEIDGLLRAGSYHCKHQVDGSRLVGGREPASMVRWIGEDPRNARVLLQLADLWMRQGEPTKAEDVIQDALTRKVDEPRFLLELGESQIEARRFDAAEQSLEQALAKNPGWRRCSAPVHCTSVPFQEMGKARSSVSRRASSKPSLPAS